MNNVQECDFILCLSPCPQATGVDCLPGGQRGRARHRADAVHQRGLLQAKEAAARLVPKTAARALPWSGRWRRSECRGNPFLLNTIPPGCILKTSQRSEVYKPCLCHANVSFSSLPETVLKFRALKKPAQLAVINSLEKVLALPPRALHWNGSVDVAILLEYLFRDSLGIPPSHQAFWNWVENHSDEFTMLYQRPQADMAGTNWTEGFSSQCFSLHT